MTSLKPLLKSPARLFSLGLVLVSAAYLVLGEKPGAALEAARELKAAGEDPDLGSSVTIGLYLGFGVALVGSLGLLCTARWWSRPLPGPVVALPVASGIAGRVFWIGVAVALVLAGGLRWNLARGSLWWDELWNIKYTMVGNFRPDAKKDNVLTFREAPWKMTVWHYSKPTNHPPMAVASRLSLDAWRIGSGGAPGSFNEVAARLPSLLAGLATIVVVALLLRGWGFGAGGLLAAFLMAIHPWHLRYGTEARAYSLIVLCVALGCLFLTRALRTGAWRWWILFGANQFLLTWTLPISCLFSAAFLAAAAALILRTRKGKADRSVALCRLLVVNGVAGMAFLVVFLPNVLQAMGWGKVNDHQYLTSGLLLETLCQMGFGIAKHWGENADTAGLVSIEGLRAANPWFFGFMVLAMGASFVWGGILLWRKARSGAVIFAFLAAAGAGYLLLTWKLGQHFYPRYLIYLLVPTLACVAVGAGGAVRSGKWRPIAPILFLVTFAMFTWPQVRVLNTRSYAPFREAARAARDLAGPDGMIVCHGLGGRVITIYDKEIAFTNNLPELRAVTEAAKAGGKPLFLVLGYRAFNAIHKGAGDGFILIDDPELFEQVAAFPGIEDLFYFRIYRYLPTTGPR
jgi:hypothetical protein